jgi:hypothetical protein
VWVVTCAAERDIPRSRAAWKAPCMHAPQHCDSIECASLVFILSVPSRRRQRPIPDAAFGVRVCLCSCIRHYQDKRDYIGRSSASTKREVSGSLTAVQPVCLTPAASILFCGRIVSCAKLIGLSRFSGPKPLGSSSLKSSGCGSTHIPRCLVRSKRRSVSRRAEARANTKR